MNDKELKYMISVFNSPLDNKVYNYDYKKHYNNLIIVLNTILKKFSNSIILQSEGIKYLIDKIIKIIWEKIENHQSLSSIEGETFLYFLINETIDILHLDKSKICEIKFVDRGTEKLPETGRAMHYHDRDGMKKIYYDKKLIDEICNENIDSVIKITKQMRIICHELIHFQQTQNSCNNILDINAYISSIEYVFRELDPTYYLDNYKFTRLETDANTRGLFAVASFLYNHKLLPTKTLSTIVKNLEQYLLEQIKESENHNIKYNQTEDKAGRIMMYACSEILKKHPEDIKFYKLLSLSYNQDGSLKSIKQLFKYRLFLIKRNPNALEMINKIYEYIFDCYITKIMYKEDFIFELCSYLKEVNGRDEFALKIYINNTNKDSIPRQKLNI